MYVHETEALLDINHNNDTRDELAEASTGDWYDNLEVRNHCLSLPSLIHPCQPLLWDVPTEEVKDLHNYRETSPLAEVV